MSQAEQPDNWLRFPDPWEVARPDECVEVNFGSSFTLRDGDLDVIPNEARAVQAEACLSNSFAFGGLNAALAFKAWR